LEDSHDNSNDELILKGPFDGQDRIEAEYDIKLDRDRI